MADNINCNGLKINENNNMICSKYDGSSYNKELNEIMLNNNDINDCTKKIESQIENIIKDYSNNSLDIKFKNIKDSLTKIDENIKKNNEIIFNLLNKTKPESNIAANISTNIENKNKKSNEKINLVKSEKNLKDINHKNILNKISSNYILKRVFSYLYERNKLDLIKYNNSLKNKIDIKLLNYKLYSGKYMKIY